MTSAAHPRTTTRLLAGAGALLFVAVFFALPLYAAASLCTMPCCHHAKAAAISTGMAGCTTQCTLHGVEVTTPKTVSIATPQSRLLADAPASVVVIAAGGASEVAHLAPDVGPPHPAAAPLHVLNSLFRI